jgi:membrane protease YdiL (CAAX protease family)
VILVVFVVAYYRFGKRALFSAAQTLAQRIGGTGRYNRSEIAGVLELVAAAASHVVAVTALLLISGVRFADIGLGSTPWQLVVLGALLGVAEVALSSMFCRLAISGALTRIGGRTRRPASAAPALARAGAKATSRPDVAQASPTTMESWLALGRGGWIRHHLRTMEVIPLPLAVLISAVQVGSEEIVFRGIIVNVMRDAGPVVALTVSILLFVSMQVFFMSNWRGAMFPVVGAIVMGVVNGLLYWQNPVLLPLIIAHVLFFFAAVK